MSLTFLAALPVGARAQTPRPLAPAEVRDSSLGPDERHLWEVDAERGTYQLVAVRQLGVDLVVRLRAPDGDPRRLADLPTGRAGTERLGWIADVGGAWQVEVEAATPGATGRYRIEWIESGPAGPDAERVVEVDRTREQATLHQKRDEHAEAARLYEAARQLALALPRDEPARALALYTQAVHGYRRGLLERAGPWLEEAASAARDAFGAGDPELAPALTTLAAYRAEMGRYEEADRLLSEAVELLRAAFGPRDLDFAAGLNNLAALYQYQARYAEAEPLYLEALEIRTAALGAGHPDVAEIQGNLGLLYQTQGRVRDARARLERALEIVRETRGARDPEAVPVLENLGWLDADEGRYAEAELYHRQALAIVEATTEEHHPARARALSNLAALAQMQGRVEEAEPLYREALELWGRADPAPLDAAFTMDNLALLLGSDGRTREAERLHETALSLLEAADPHHPDVALTLSHLGLLRDEQGRFPDAEALHRRALSILEAAHGPDHPDVALALMNLAHLRLRQEELDEAEEAVSRAIAILDRVPLYPAERINAYALRATVLRRAGRRDEALDDLDEALVSAEELRPQVGGGEEARARFFGRYADHFDRMVLWLMEAGEIEDAFEVAERGRARVLLDQLAAGRVDIRSSIPPAVRDELEAREREARARMVEYQDRLAAIQHRTDLPATELVRRAQSLTDSLRAADLAYRQVYRDIKTASPLWRDMITAGGEPVSLRDVQRRLVPEDGLLLLYQLGSDGSLVFVVPPSGEDVAAYPLEVTAELGARLGVEPGPLTAADVERAIAGDPGGGMPGLAEAVRGAEPVRGTSVAGRRPKSLSMIRALLVPDSLWARVATAEETIVVPDGALHGLPFEALEVPASDGSVQYWLDAGPVIRYAASATALHNIERRPDPLPTAAAGPVILSLSDPVFAPDNGPVHAPDDAAPGGYEASDTRAVTRSRYGSWAGPLPPLPGTARESRAILETLADARVAGQLEVLDGPDATERNLREALPGKRFLHLATHGLVDQRRGSLFASLALTPPPDGSLQPDNDGLWQLHEVYEFQLPELELAVLSACETNIGTAVMGEGVFALSRGFLVAGARRVVATQWQVNDESTAALIGSFFRQVLTAAAAGEAVDYARALRDAKREIRATGEWSAPYHWAPFVLTGRQ